MWSEMFGHKIIISPLPKGHIWAIWHPREGDDVRLDMWGLADTAEEAFVAVDHAFDGLTCLKSEEVQSV